VTARPVRRSGMHLYLTFDARESIWKPRFDRERDSRRRRQSECECKNRNSFPVAKVDSRGGEEPPGGLLGISEFRRTRFYAPRIRTCADAPADAGASCSRSSILGYRVVNHSARIGATSPNPEERLALARSSIERGIFPTSARVFAFLPAVSRPIRPRNPELDVNLQCYCCYCDAAWRDAAIRYGDPCSKSGLERPYMDVRCAHGFPRALNPTKPVRAISCRG